MIVSDNTIQSEVLICFFRKLRRLSAKPGEKLAANVLKNPGRALEIIPNIATAASTKKPKAASSSLPWT